MSPTLKNYDLRVIWEKNNEDEKEVLSIRNRLSV